MVMIPMLQGDRTNATSRLNLTSQTEVSSEENILQVEYCYEENILMARVNQNRWK
jgi:hypothetical protein